MKRSDGGKGDTRRPGKGFNEGHDLIDWGRRKALCGACLKPADKCGCMPTEDGPGDDEVKKLMPPSGGK